MLFRSNSVIKRVWDAEVESSEGGGRTELKAPVLQFQIPWDRAAVGGAQNHRVFYTRIIVESSSQWGGVLRASRVAESLVQICRPAGVLGLQGGQLGKHQHRQQEPGNLAPALLGGIFGLAGTFFATKGIAAIKQIYG